MAAELVLMHFHVPYLSWEAAGALLLGCVAGPLADVDKQGSTMAKVLFPLSALLRIAQVRHRTVTHSVLFMMLLYGITAPLPSIYASVFLMAYATHPLIDLLNEKGVQLLWPLKFKIRLLPKFMAVDTGSSAETVFQWLLLAVSLWLPFSTIEF